MVNAPSGHASPPSNFPPDRFIVEIVIELQKDVRELKQSVGELKGSVDAVERELTDFKLETRSKFDSQDRKLSELSNDLHAVRRDIQSAKVAMYAVAAVVVGVGGFLGWCLKLAVDVIIRK